MTQPSPFATNIVVATDFSPAAEAGLEKAAQIARTVGARVTVCHVLDPSPLAPIATRGMSGHQISSEQEIEKAIHAALDSTVERCFGGVDTKVSLIISTNAADGIVRYADKEGVDLIVLSTHGRTGLAHLLIGSVAERVVRHATCPVLTVRAPADAAETDA